MDDSLAPLLVPLRALVSLLNGDLPNDRPDQRFQSEPGSG
jgi:hypothetical protein